MQRQNALETETLYGLIHLTTLMSKRISDTNSSKQLIIASLKTILSIKYLTEIP